MTRSIKIAMLTLSAGSLIACFSQVAAVAQFRPTQTTLGNETAAANSPIGLALAIVNGQMTVTGIAPNGPFAGALHVGDQITGLNDQAVTNISDLLSRFMAAGSTGQAATASLDIMRNGRPQAINVSNAALGRITQAISNVGFPAAVTATGGGVAANATTTGQTNNTSNSSATGTTTAANVLQESLGANAGTTILSGTATPINSTGTTNPINSTGTATPINSIGTATPINSTGTATPINSTGTTNPINSTGTTNPINSTGTANPVNSTGTTNPINSTGTANGINSTGTTSPTTTANATTLPIGAGTSTSAQLSGATTGRPELPKDSANTAAATPITQPTTASANAIGATGATAANSATAQLDADLGVSLSFVNNSVTVTGIGTSGALANIGLQAGDQIAAIDGQQVTSIADALRDLLSAAQQGQNSLTQTATMTISRNGVSQMQNLPQSALTGLLQAQAQILAAIASMPISTGTTTNAQLNGTTTGRPELPKGTALDNDRPFEAAEQQSNLPTTVLTPQGPRIAMPGERAGQQRGAGGATGLPNAEAKSGGKAGGAAKSANGANKAGGAKAGGAARGGGGGAPATPGGS